MKKFLLFSVALLSTVFLYAQTCRNIVVIEVGTATWCTYCPGSALAIEQMTTEGRSIGVIEYHSSDSYTNAASTARLSYYNMTGIPTAEFDGLNASVGGLACGQGSVYSDYMNRYNLRLKVPSPISICLTGSNTGGNNYTVNVTARKLGTVSGTDLRLHFVLTESHIPESWEGCMTEVNFVERLMIPDQNGTSFSFSSGDVQSFTLNFAKDPSWVLSNCQVVAFVQDNSSKEIYCGVKSDLSTMPGTMMSLTDFSGSPTSGCAPVTVNFSSTGSNISTYTWTFPGGTPATGSTPSPSIVYNSTGTFNVSLVGTNGVCKDSIGKTAYLNITAIPAQPVEPTGTTGMCTDPANQTYYTTAVTGATSYTWDLSPANAGTLTPSSTSCVVDFSSTFEGVAMLKVRASNTCGDSPWSNALSINISAPPGIPGTPTGPTQLCMNPLNSDYTTSGTAPVTAYTWELTPSYAGALYPNYTSCSVDWVNDFTGTAQIRVKGTDNSCEGPWSDFLAINIDGGPIEYSMTGGGVYCATGGSGSPVGLSGSQPNVNYELYLDGVPTSTVVTGTGAPISFGNQTSVGTYTCVATNANTCTSTQMGTAVVTTDPQAPAIPGTPAGPDHVYSGSTPTTDYTTNGAQYASTYTWSLSPAAAGTMSGSTTTGTATWNQSYSGTASVTVTGVNSCGGGTVSQSYDITVGTGLGIAEPTKQNLVTLYPNPAKGFVNIIPSRELNVNIRVYNSMGTIVIDLGNINLKDAYRLNTTTLAPGVYFFNFTSDNFQEIRKIVIE